MPQAPKNVKMTPVSSTNISEVGYDEPESQLYVRFKNGKLYCYDGVPEGDYLTFMGAASKGKYFEHAIKRRYASGEIL
jgi:hypothetical protein